MPCPTCRGATRTEISPGYWRCDTTITTEREGPGFQRPGSGPPVLYDTRVCGEHYVEASSTPNNLGLCACNTSAIGYCSECRRPVCGTHSGLWDGRRLCDEHYEVKAAAERATDAQSEYERRRAFMADWEAEQQEKARKEAEELAHEANSRRQVIQLLEELSRRGNPGSKRIKVRKAGHRNFIEYHRRRGWLIHQEGMREYWVTTEGEYLNGLQLSVASINLCKSTSLERDPIGPFDWNYTELRWSGILRKLKTYL